MRFASASGSTPISAALVQPPPPGVPGAGVGLSTAGPQPGLGAGHDAPGGGTASTQWTLPAWSPPPGWWDMAPAAKKAAPFFMGEALPLVSGRAVDKILAGDYIDIYGWDRWMSIQKKGVNVQRDVMHRDPDKSSRKNIMETPDPRRDQFSQRASLSFFYMVRAGFRRILGRQYSNSPDTVLYVTVVRTTVLL